jgi:hypothetical protein
VVRVGRVIDHVFHVLEFHGGEIDREELDTFLGTALLDN